MALPSSGSSALGSAAFVDGPKKRRAPLPPVLVSQSGSVELSPRRRINSEPNTHLDGVVVREKIKQTGNKRKYGVTTV